MTNNSFFLNDSFLLPMVIGAIVVWILFIYKELPIRNRIRFVSRVLVVTNVIVCLLMIVLVPVVNSSKSGNKVILLTENFSQKTLDSLKKTDKELQVLSYESNTKIIPDSLNIESVIILGNGIEHYDLWQLNAESSIFLKGEDPKGIIDLRFPKEQLLYNDLAIEGAVKPRNLMDRIVLENPSENAVDSIVLESDEIQNFKLETSLKVSGNFIYHLIEKDSTGNIISRNPIPIQVADSKPLNILMLLSNPSFESKYLKNFLSDNNNSLVSRTRLTRGRYKFEYFNVPRIPVLRLNNEHLEEFDLIIADWASINNLNNSEFNALQLQISENGLGLFYLADQEVFTTKLKISNFNIEYIANNSTTLDKDSPIEIDRFPYSFDEDQNLYPIHRDGDYINSASYKVGFGNVGSTVFKDTYRLLLKGQDSIYKKMWTKLLSNLSKSMEKIAELQLIDNLNYVDEPLRFKIRTALDNPQLLADEGYIIPLKQDYELTYVWSGLTYPRKFGWQTFDLQQDSINPLYFYVFNEGDWTGIRTQEKISRNENHFNNGLVDASTIIYQRPINLFYFYLLALLGLAYLWLVPKLGLKNL